jgi:hypothetical protein
MIKNLLAKYSRANINLPLLVFLLLFLDVKFVVKILGLIFVILYYKDFRFGLSWKKSRLPLFYGAIIAIELFKYILVTRNYSFNYFLVFGLGILQWSMSLLAIHFIRLMVEKDQTYRIHNTVKAFYLINFAVSVFFLLLLLFHPSLLRFWGHGTGLYFSHSSAGDAILGVTFDASTVNAVINSIGLVYFLFKKEYTYCLLNVLTIVLCTSNVTFLLALGLLVLMVCTVRSRQLRLASIVASVVLIFLYVLYSPKNREYARNYFVQLYVVNKLQAMEEDSETITIRQGDSLITIKRPVRIPSDSLYSFSEKKLGRSIGNFLSLKEFIENKDSDYVIMPASIYESRPGKLISFIQTGFFLKRSLKNLLFGSGIGNFSSKLAFRASGVHALGSYPRRYLYTSSAFQHNHLQTYLHYYHMDASKHSVLNYPFSVYNQLLGEYGLIGFILFFAGYIWYFVSRSRNLSYGRYLIIGLLGCFCMEYWFEFFSLVILFELFMFLNLKEDQEAIRQASQAAVLESPLKVE